MNSNVSIVFTEPHLAAIRYLQSILQSPSAELEELIMFMVRSPVPAIVDRCNASYDQLDGDVLVNILTLLSGGELDTTTTTGECNDPSNTTPNSN